jgi:hypothetical protein
VELLGKIPVSERDPPIAIDVIPQLADLFNVCHAYRMTLTETHIEPPPRVIHLVHAKLVRRHTLAEQARTRKHFVKPLTRTERLSGRAGLCAQIGTSVCEDAPGTGNLCARAPNGGEAPVR